MTILVADFGGTHARAAFARNVNGRIELSGIRAEALPSTLTPAQWLGQYFRNAGEPPVDACAACAAGPLEIDGNDRVVRFTNRASEVRASALAQACGLQTAQLINDFAAVAHAVPALSPDELIPLGKTEDAEAVEGAPQLVLGPGTGLGVAIRVPGAVVGVTAQILPGEGGHAALAPFDEETYRLWLHLTGENGQLSAEQILSGPGLLRLYRGCIAEAGGTLETDPSPAQIAEKGLAGTDPHSARSVRLFVRWLGYYAGSLALIAGARGGVFIAGGILPAWFGQFDAEIFRQAFETQPEQRDYVRAIPTHLMRHAQPALLGLAALADSSL